MFFSFAPPRVERAERIDSLDPSEADFAASFADVARVNRYLGGTRVILTRLPRLLARLPADRPVRILDIATGSADIPRALVSAFRQGRFGTGRQTEITALDNHPKVIALAKAQTPASRYPEIRVVSGDAFQLPYPDRAFDITLCSLAFHHFGYGACVEMLRQMARLSAAGFIVNDLLRDGLACGLIWTLTRLVQAHPLTRHDAPLSVLRAYTRQEYRRMVEEAAISDVFNCTVELAPMYRVALVGERRTDLSSSSKP